MNLKILGVLLTCFLIASLTPIAAFQYGEINSTIVNYTVNSNWTVNSTVNSSIRNNSTNSIFGNKSDVADWLIHPSDINEKIDTISLLINQWFGININVFQLHDEERLQNVLKTYLKDYSSKNVAIEKRNVFIVTENNGKISFLRLIDGDIDYNIYVFEDSSGGNIVKEGIPKGCTDMLLVVSLNDNYLENVNMTKLGSTMDYLANNYNKALDYLKPTNNTNSTMLNGDSVTVYRFAEWVCLHLLQFFRMAPAFVGWDELKVGMVPLVMTNKTNYNSIKPALITSKTKNSIVLRASDDGRLYEINKTVFLNKLYTGIALKQVDNNTWFTSWTNMTVTNETSSLMGLNENKQNKILGYIGYLFQELFKLNINDLNIKSNAFINAAWMTVHLFMATGIKSTIKRMSLSEVREEYPQNPNMMLILTDSSNHWYYVPIVGVNEHSFDIMLGNETKTTADWDLGYTGMVLLPEGNYTPLQLGYNVNLLLENIDPLPPDAQPSFITKAREWISDPNNIILSIILASVILPCVIGLIKVTAAGIASIAGLSAAAATGAAATGAAASGPPGWAFLAATCAVVVVAVLIVGVSYGIYSLVNYIIKKNKFNKLKDRYNAKKI